MAHISIFVIILFIVTTFFTVWLFYKASGKSKTVLFVLSAWMLLQAIMGLTGFYQQTQSIPPRFVFFITPGLIVIALLLLTERGRSFIDSFQLRELTLLHTIRIFVELTLYFMFLVQLVPLIMTFEGFNYDIFSGLTTPIVYYVVFVFKKADKKFLLVWNFICLALLLNIVTIAILSLPTPFQKLAFEQPNIGLGYFPFVWLPSVVVPIVLLSHLVSIRKLIVSLKENKV